MSELKVNKLSPRSGTAVTLGDSGDTFTIPSGATLAIAGSVTGFTSAGIDDNATSVAITINSSEQVGIGTTSPSSLLHIFSSAPKLIIQDGGTHGTNSAPRLEFKDNSSIQGFVEFADDGTMRIDQLKANPLTFLTNNVERMRITSAGSVGIGTTSPARTLDVKSSSSTAIRVDGGTDGSHAAFFESAIGGTSHYQFGVIDNSNNFSIYDSQNTATRFIIDSSGNVGIGTSSPGHKLEVSGNVKANNFTNRTSVQGIDPTPDDANRFELGAGYLNLYRDDTAEVNQIQFGKNGTLAAAFSTGANYLAIKTNGDNERMRIDSSGNVLVGKTSTTNSVAGSKLGPGGQIVATVANDDIMILNRTGTDGKILRLFKDTSEVGNIGVRSGLSDIYIESVSSGRLRANGTDVAGWNSSTGTFFSATDNGNDLGTTVNRWNDLYLGGGLYVGGTAAANKLDDYEEGTWTPNIIYGGTITVNNKYGSYVKIGNLVYISVYVTITSVSSPSGDLRIGSLPFTPDNSSSASPAFSMSYYNWASGTYFLNGELNYGNNYIYIYTNNNGVRSSSASKVQAASQFHLAGSYIST